MSGIRMKTPLLDRVVQLLMSTGGADKALGTIFFFCRWRMGPLQSQADVLLETAKQADALRAIGRARTEAVVFPAAAANKLLNQVDILSRIAGDCDTARRMLRFMFNLAVIRALLQQLARPPASYRASGVSYTEERRRKRLYQAQQLIYWLTLLAKCSFVVNMTTDHLVWAHNKGLLALSPELHARLGRISVMGWMFGAMLSAPAHYLQYSRTAVTGQAKASALRGLLQNILDVPTAACFLGYGPLNSTQQGLTGMISMATGAYDIMESQSQSQSQS